MVLHFKPGHEPRFCGPSRNASAAIAFVYALVLDLRIMDRWIERPYLLIFLAFYEIFSGIWCPRGDMTSAVTLGSIPTSLRKVPPQEWATNTVGPSCSANTRRVSATESASVVSGFCAAVTFRPAA
jgi:hypothetical protein